MIRNYCDKCNEELSNTYWKTPQGQIIKRIEIKMDGSTVMEMLLCKECGEAIESMLFELFDWFQNKEQEEADKLELNFK